MPPKKTRSTLQGDLLPGDFTPGQYILGICIALFFGLSCFGLGIVIGRRDPAPHAQERPAAAVPAATAKKAEGVQTSPRLPGAMAPLSEPEPRRPSMSSGAGATAETTAASVGGGTPHATTPTGGGVMVRPGRDGVTVTAQAAPSADSGTAAASSVPTASTPGASAASAHGAETAAAAAAAAKAAPSAVAAPSAAGGTPAVPSATVSTTPPAGSATKTAAGSTATASAATPPASGTKPPAPTATPVTPPEEFPARTAASTAAAKPGTAVAPSGSAAVSGKWGIQVASLSGATRQKGADDLVRRLRETSGLTAQAIPTSDGAALRVVVVGFSTREAADKACSELKQKPEFKGAFVKPL